MKNLELLSMLSILKDEKDNTAFQVLKDELSNTVANVSVKNEKGEIELKPIYIPKMYIAANTYRKLFKENYPYGRITVEILHKENGDNFTVNTLEEKGSLTQEVVKVSLFESREDQLHSLPLSEGIGAIYYRAEKEYNNNAVATAQGKAFAVAMKNLGITLSETEEDREELLKELNCYIEVETDVSVSNGGSKTYFKCIGKAYPFYQQLKSKIYNDECNEVVARKNSIKEESHTFKSTEENLDENKKMLSKAIHSALDSFEEVEETSENLAKEEIEEPTNETIPNEVDVKEEEPEQLELVDSEEESEVTKDNLKKAVNTPLNLKASYDNPAFVEKFGGKTFEEIKELRSTKWIATLERIENDMTAKTRRAFNVLKDADFEF